MRSLRTPIELSTTWFQYFFFVTKSRVLTDNRQYHGGCNKPEAVATRNKSFHTRNEDEASGNAGSEDELDTDERAIFPDKLPSHRIICRADAGK